MRPMMVSLVGCLPAKFTAGSVGDMTKKIRHAIRVMSRSTKTTRAIGG
jgi:hypothetical protein